MMAMLETEQLSAALLLMVRATVFVSLAHLLLTLLRRRSAASREAMGRWLLLGLVLLPVVALSGWTIGVLPDFTAPVIAEPVVEAPPFALPAATAAPLSVDPIEPSWTWSDVAGAAVLVWILVAAGWMVHAAAGHVVAQRRLFGRGARPLPAQLRESLSIDDARLAVLSPAAIQPVVAGLFRPRIALPEAFAGWSPARQAAVLAHERAHVERRDGAGVILRQLARAIWWPHPLVWMLGRRLSLLCEQACDDRVLDHGVGAVAYAEALVDVARDLRGSSSSHHHVLAMTTTTQLEARVRALLRSDVARARPRTGIRVAAAFLALSLGLLCAAGSAVAQDPVVGPPKAPLGKQKQGPAATSDVLVTDGVAKQAFVLAVTGKGEVFYGNREIGEKGVQPLLKKLFAAGVQPVVVQSSRDTQAGLLVRVIDAAKKAGAVDVSVATLPVPANSKQPRPVSRTGPKLTAAMKKRAPALVDLIVTVNKKGDVVAVEVARSSSEFQPFRAAAIAAVKKWEFAPGTEDGKPVRKKVRIPIHFPAADGRTLPPLSTEDRQRLERIGADRSTSTSDLSSRLRDAWERKRREAVTADKEAKDILRLIRKLEEQEAKARAKASEERAETFGSITGRIEDKAFEGPLESARVQIQETGDRTRSARDGTFRITRLPPGTYTLLVSKKGYEQQQLKVVVTKGKATEVSATMPTKFVEMGEFEVGGGR